MLLESQVGYYYFVEHVTLEPLEILIEKHAPLVKRIAHHLLARLPKSILLDDLLQAGMIGLIEAAKNYNEEKGASFETYAGIRIRGTMLDEVRKGDWVPRSVHRNGREISEKIRKIEHQTGRDAKDHEVANALSMSLDDYHQRLADVSSSRLFALDDVIFEEVTLSELVPGNSPDPFEDVQYETLKSKIAESIATLPERERLVLALYYQEELNLKEIGLILSVSESRVSQIHSQAMLRLQARLQGRA